MEPEKEEFRSQVKLIYRYLVMTLVLIAAVFIGVVTILIPKEINSEYQEIVTNEVNIDPSEIVDGIHIPTGFQEGDGLPIVIEACTACHSAKLVTQNRATREGWIGMIRWMQQTQNLWDLGEDEEAIVKYLATYYAPEQKGRREILTNIEWYDLDK
ncbi:monoheme cytochrome C [Flavobacteriaceae bacterium R38]|nr:monoheme cytochrome C [Flavobacteriaceae bacterium R38]